VPASPRPGPRARARGAPSPPNCNPINPLQARPEVEVKATRPIQLRDVQALVQWVLADGACPKWVFTKVRPIAVGAALPRQPLWRRRHVPSPPAVPSPAPSTSAALPCCPVNASLGMHRVTQPTNPNRTPDQAADRARGACPGQRRHPGAV
jgi:hypothetical protein